MQCVTAYHANQLWGITPNNLSSIKDIGKLAAVTRCAVVPCDTARYSPQNTGMWGIFPKRDGARCVPTLQPHYTHGVTPRAHCTPKSMPTNWGILPNFAVGTGIAIPMGKAPNLYPILYYAPSTPYCTLSLVLPPALTPSLVPCTVRLPQSHVLYSLLSSVLSPYCTTYSTRASASRSQCEGGGVYSWPHTKS